MILKKTKITAFKVERNNRKKRHKQSSKSVLIKEKKT